MHDPFVVSGGEAVRDLNRVVEGAAWRHRRVMHPVAKCLALQKLGDDVWRAVSGPQIEDGQKIWMIEDAGGVSFLLKPGQPIGIRSSRGPQDLDRDVAPDAR